MGRRKNLGDLEDFEKELIENKMRRPYADVDPSLSKIQQTRYKIEIKCKNQKQKEFLKLLKNEDKELCFGIGSAGSGKSYISLAYALSALKDPNNAYEKIIILIPTLQSCSSPLSMGYLPGDLDEKTKMYTETDLKTFEKILKNSGNLNSKVIIDDLIKMGRIEFKFVNFIRGATYDNAIVLVNEAEGYNDEEMLLILTRIGENCKCVITGDEAQIIRKDLKGKSGMKHGLDKLQHLAEVGFTEFENQDIVRNPLIGKIIECWKK